MSDENKYPIRPFRFWVQHVLPLVYDDSLSYLEVLYKVKVKLNEVIEWCNTYESKLYDYVDQKTQENLDELQKQLAAFQSDINIRLNSQDQKINQVTSQINNILNTVNGLIEQFRQEMSNSMTQFQLDIQTDIRNFENKVNGQIADNEAWVKAQILLLQTQTNSQIEILRQQIVTNLEESKTYTDEQIAKLTADLGEITSILVTYPGNQKVVSVQTAIDWLWYDLSFFTLTAEEYDALDLTSQEYDNHNLSAYQYDYFGKWYLKLIDEIGSGTGSGTVDTVARNLAEQAQLTADTANTNANNAIQSATTANQNATDALNKSTQNEEDIATLNSYSHITPITQSHYNDLTEEQTENKIYLIKDGEQFPSILTYSQFELTNRLANFEYNIITNKIILLNSVIIGAQLVFTITPPEQNYQVTSQTVICDIGKWSYPFKVGVNGNSIALSEMDNFFLITRYNNVSTLIFKNDWTLRLKVPYNIMLGG